MVAQFPTGFFCRSNGAKITTFLLRANRFCWHSKAVKRWPYIVILVIVAGVIGYYLLATGQLHWPARSTADAANSSPAAENIAWHAVLRPRDGFKIEMPDGVKDSEAPAYDSDGNNEPVKMLSASPDGNTVYAITWQDNPPVARAHNNSPDVTLDQARDGMLAHTQTTLIKEARITVDGNSAREILAQNSSGGILNARLIFTKTGRLYTLLALFPTAGARNPDDVNRFFDSFGPLVEPPSSANGPQS